MGPVDWVAFIFVIIGSLNWGLVSIGYNPINALFGSWPVVENIIYGLVGLSSLIMIVMAFMSRKHNAVSSEI